MGWAGAGVGVGGGGGGVGVGSGVPLAAPCASVSASAVRNMCTSSCRRSNSRLPAASTRIASAASAACRPLVSRLYEYRMESAAFPVSEEK